MRSRASGGICGDSSAAPSAATMSSLRRRAIWVTRARSIGAQLDRRPRQRAHHRAGVARVDEQPQPREQVAHLGALEERRRARQPVGHRALLERHRDRLALRAHRAHEHADVLGRARPRARPAARPRPPRPAPARARTRSPERDLARALRGRAAPSAGLARRDRAAPRARSARAERKRLLEPHHPRRRPLRLEVGERLRRGAAEAVDRLVVVAGAADVAVLAGQQPQQQALGEARVLEVVDEHVAVAGRDPRAHVRLLAQQPERAQDQVAEVERRRPRRASGRGRGTAAANSRSRAPSLGVRQRRRPRRRSPRTVTSSSLSRSIRATIEPSSALGLPRRSWWRSGSSSMRSSSIARRSAARDRRRERVDARPRAPRRAAARAQKPWKVATAGSS